MLSMIEFTQTDLPEPVVPAISKCGMSASSATSGLPTIAGPAPAAASRAWRGTAAIPARANADGVFLLIRDFDAMVFFPGIG